MIKLRILRGSVYLGFLSRWALNTITCIFIRERQSFRETSPPNPPGREGDVKTEAEIGVMGPQANKCLNQQKCGLTRNGIFPRASVGNVALPTP